MSYESLPAAAAMESGGSYNLHANIPAGGGGLALPILELAARNITLNGGSQPVVIADYGSSQGKNSLGPMRAAIAVLRSRLGSDHPISVVHVDQPKNDFNTLFGVLQTDPDRYAAQDPLVFPSAVGRSFYEQVFPPQHVDLGWSSYAVVWLSRLPVLIPDHFMAVRSSPEVRVAFDRQAAEDWKTFLSLRARELRPGGRLVIVLPAISDEGAIGLEDLFDQANASLAEMVAAGLITSQERSRMAIRAHPRGRAQLLAPFAPSGTFCELKVEHCEVSDLPDAAWADYQRDGDKEALVSRQAAFFRSIFVPSLAAALADPAASETSFAGRFEQILKRRLAERPTPMHTFVQTMVVAKQDSAVSPSAKH